MTPTWTKSSYCANDTCLEVAWTKSTHSSTGNCLEWATTSHCTAGNCIEVSNQTHQVLVRDSKNPNGPHLSFTPTQWNTFTRRIKDGQFD